MLAVLTVLGCVAFVEPAARKEPPAREELAAIAERGRNLAGYDAAAWHASDALQKLQPKQGAVAQYIARQTDKGWIVAFGRLDEAKESFLIAYRASQGDKPDEFRVEELTPPTKDATFFLAAARSIDTALRDFVEHYQGERRPYNVAVLPAENDQLWVYLVPAPTKVGVWPLGGRRPLPDLGRRGQGRLEAAAPQVDHRGRASRGQGEAAGRGRAHPRPGRRPRGHRRLPRLDQEARRARDGRHDAVRLRGRPRRRRQIRRKSGRSSQEAMIAFGRCGA